MHEGNKSLNMFAIHFVNSRTAPQVFVAGDSFNEICHLEYPIGVLLGINQPILLAMVRLEC